jgi:hypothetical protein
MSKKAKIKMFDCYIVAHLYMYNNDLSGCELRLHPNDKKNYGLFFPKKNKWVLNK